MDRNSYQYLCKEITWYINNKSGATGKSLKDEIQR